MRHLEKEKTKEVGQRPDDNHFLTDMVNAKEFVDKSYSVIWLRGGYLVYYVS